MFKLGLDFTEIQALFRNVNWIFNINTKNLHLCSAGSLSKGKDVFLIKLRNTPSVRK